VLPSRHGPWTVTLRCRMNPADGPCLVTQHSLATRCFSPELLRRVPALLCAADASVPLRPYRLPSGLCTRCSSSWRHASGKPTLRRNWQTTETVLPCFFRACFSRALAPAFLPALCACSDSAVSLAMSRTVWSSGWRRGEGCRHLVVLAVGALSRHALRQRLWQANCKRLWPKGCSPARIKTREVAMPKGCLSRMGGFRLVGGTLIWLHLTFG